MSYLKCFVFAVLAACGTFVGLAEDCTHEFGPWSVVTPASFVSAGTRVHTCSLCHEEFSEPYGPYVRPATDNAGCYVTEGLVHQWDGIRNAGADAPHDSAATTWTDLVGSMTLTLYSGSGASFTDNALKRTAGSAKPFATGTSITDAKTVELVFKRLSSSASDTYAFMLSLGGDDCNNGRGVLGIEGSTIGSNRHGFFTSERVTKGDFVTVSFYPDVYTNSLADAKKLSGNLFVDGLAVANSNTDENWSGVAASNGFMLGGRSSSSSNVFKGEIFACRVYDRHLDPSELAQNAALDRARFATCAHDGAFGPWTVVTEATKTSAGTHKHTCGLCGAEIEESYGPLIGVVINEVIASNDKSLATANGGKGLDWIEIYNCTDADIDLTGWKLTDNPAKPAKAVAIEHPVTIPASGYQVVFVDKDYDNFAADEPFARLGLSSSGETLALYDADGNLVGGEIAFPALMKDVSWGLKPGTSDDWAYFKTPTPNAVNSGTPCGPPTPKVTFSVPHGYKTEAFDVTLSCPENPDAAIYYTTDGSSPTTASTLYTSAIHIDHTTVIRAAVPTENALLQYDTSATYLFLEDIYQQSEANRPAGFPLYSTGKDEGTKYKMYLGMRTDIVDGPDRDKLDRSFTNGIDTLSIVIDTECLFNTSTGIYVNGGKDGREWERPMVLECISPTNGAAVDVTIPSGLRIRGGYSRQQHHPKHALRFYFREEYGEDRLVAPLFGDEGTDSFKKMDLRCSQNYSWAAPDLGGTDTVTNQDTFVHEVFSRDMQREMGEPYTRSRYQHLFINGIYWGLYQTQERGDEDFAESYLGGDADDYDLIKKSDESGQSYPTYAAAGTMDAWSNLWHIAVNEGFGDGHEDNFMKILGRDPDGSRNTDYPILLDLTNMIVYVISSQYTADSDTPASVAKEGYVNNLYELRNRIDDETGTDHRNGFISLRHDAEHTLGTDNTGDKRTQFSHYTNDVTTYGTIYQTAFRGSPAHPEHFGQLHAFNPAELHWRLCSNATYRLIFADLVQKHCLAPDGILHPDNAWALFQSRMNEVGDAVVAEAARWGTKGQTWQTWYDACLECKKFIDERLPYFIQHYRNRGWFPSIEAPTADQASGIAAPGTVVNFSAKAEDAVDGIYITTDGADPADAGVAAATAVTVASLPCTVKARALKGTEWSALTEVTLEPERQESYTFSGSDYTGPQTVYPLGDECTITLDSATLPGLVLTDGAKYTLVLKGESQIASITGPSAHVALTGGDGDVLKLEGADTLVSISNLIVKSGTLDVKLTADAAKDTAAIRLNGRFELNGGAVNLDLAACTKKVYGIQLVNKSVKDAKGEDTIFAELKGGTFNATLGGGSKSAVFKGEKGSVDITFKSKSGKMPVVNVTLNGSETRFVNFAGKIKIKDGDITVNAEDSAADVKAFKSDKEIAISGGTVSVSVPGAGSEAFECSNDDGTGVLEISGGTLEVVSDDDCFNADQMITVSGGLIYARSLNNDCFDSNGSMEISGGTILAWATGNGHEAFDVEPKAVESSEEPVQSAPMRLMALAEEPAPTTPEHVLTISGGTIFATGGAGSAWPANLVAETTVWAAEGLDASTYSEKYLSVSQTSSRSTVAKMPDLGDSTCSILVTCPDMVPETAPSVVASVDVPQGYLSTPLLSDGDTPLLSQIARDPEKYVQTGLLAHWDAIENQGANQAHDSSAKTWIDLVAGRTFTLTGATFDDNSLAFAGSPSSYGVLGAADSAATFNMAEQGTVEIVLQHAYTKGPATRCVLQAAQSTGPAFGYANGKGWLAGNTASSGTMPFASVPAGEVVTVAVNYNDSRIVPAGSTDGYFVNGGAVESQNTTDYFWYPDDKTYIGNRANLQGAFEGKILAIRVYSSRLTPEEIAANRKVDELRFTNGMLKISGVPRQIGAASDYGYRVFETNSTHTVSVSSPTFTDPATHETYTCTGWVLQDEAGNLVERGNGSSVTYTHPESAAVRTLYWIWLSDAISASPAIYVSNETGNDADTGADWAHAVKTVAAGMDKVDAGGTVYLASGWHPTTATVTLTDGVSLVGCGAKPMDVTISLGLTEAKSVNVIKIQDSANTVVTNLTVTNERRANGSGIKMNSGLVTHCRITNCTTLNLSDYGGGINMSGGAVRFCEISKCNARSSGGGTAHGGGVHMTGGLVENCRIVKCEAQYGSPSCGGGVYITGSSAASPAVLRNCLVADCIGVKGGSGVYLYQNGTVENCTIVGNRAYNANSAATGLGVYYGKDTVLRNNIIWGNLAADGVTAKDLAKFSGSDLQAANVRNNTCPTAFPVGTGNSDVPPAFIDGDSRLDYCAAVGTGYVTDDMANLVDLDGKPRTVGGLVDRGCYQRDVASVLECAIAELEKGDTQDSALVRMVGMCSEDDTDAVYTWTWTLTRKADGAVVSQNGKEFRKDDLPTGVWDVLLSVTNGGEPAEKFYDSAIDIRASRAYVSNGTGVYPYLTPETGTNSPYEAFATLGAGGVLYVGDGVFTLEHQLTLESGKGSRIESLNGPENAVIQLADSTVFRDGKYRGVKIAKANARVEGVTFVGGAKGPYNDGAAYSHYGFVLMSSAASGAVVTNCVFRDLKYSMYGVTVGVEMAAGTLVDSLFTNVIAESSGSVSIKGGVILQSGGLVDRVTVKNCKSEGTSSSTGAGDMVCVEGGVMRNSLVRSCSCVNGEAVYVNGGTFVNNTVVANTNSLPNLKEKHTYAGGVKVAAGTVANCVIADNWSKPYGAVFNLMGTTGVSYTLVNDEGTAGFVTDANHNLIAEPKFEDAAGGDYRLAWNSPAITAGSNAALGTDEELAVMLDLAGTNRLNGTTVDLGCYESAFYDRYVALEQVTGDGAGLGTLRAPINGAQKVPDGDVLVHEYVPAFDKMTQKFGLFDMVTGEFHESDTGTPFTGTKPNPHLTLVWIGGAEGDWDDPANWSAEEDPYWHDWPNTNQRDVKFTNGTYIVKLNSNLSTQFGNYLDEPGADVTFVQTYDDDQFRSIYTRSYQDVTLNGRMTIKAEQDNGIPLCFGYYSGKPLIRGELVLADIHKNHKCNNSGLTTGGGYFYDTAEAAIVFTNSYFSRTGAGDVSFTNAELERPVRLEFVDSEIIMSGQGLNLLGERATVTYERSHVTLGIDANSYNGTTVIDDSVVGYGLTAVDSETASGTLTITNLVVKGETTKFGVEGDMSAGSGEWLFVMPARGFSNDADVIAGSHTNASGAVTDLYSQNVDYSGVAPVAIDGSLDLTGAKLTVDASAITAAGTYPLVRVGGSGAESQSLALPAATNIMMAAGMAVQLVATSDGKGLDLVAKRDIASEEVEWTWEAAKVNFWYTGVAGTYPAVTGTVGGYTLRPGVDYDILFIFDNGTKTNTTDGVLAANLDDKGKKYSYRVVGKNDCEGEKDILEFAVYRQTVLWTDASGVNAVGNWSDNTWIPQTGENMGNDEVRVRAPNEYVNARLSTGSFAADIRLDSEASQPNVHKVYVTKNTTNLLHDGVLTLGINGNLTVENGATVVFSNVTVQAKSRLRELTINSYGMMVFAGDNTLDGVMPYIQGGATKGVTLSFEDGVTTITEKYDGRVSISSVGLNCNTVRVANAQVTMPTLSCFNSENTQFEFVLGDNNTVGGPAMLNVTKEFVLTQRIEEGWNVGATIDATAKGVGTYDIATLPVSFDLTDPKNAAFAPTTLAANTTCAAGFTKEITVVTDEAAGLQTVQLVLKRDLTLLTVTAPDVEYTGTAMTPELTFTNAVGEVITLQRDIDYQVEWQNNTDITSNGLARAVITGVNGWSGQVETEFRIMGNVYTWVGDENGNGAWDDPDCWYREGAGTGHDWPGSGDTVEANAKDTVIFTNGAYRISLDNLCETNDSKKLTIHILEFHDDVGVDLTVGVEASPYLDCNLSKIVCKTVSDVKGTLHELGRTSRKNTLFNIGGAQKVTPEKPNNGFPLVTGTLILDDVVQLPVGSAMTFGGVDPHLVVLGSEIYQSPWWGGNKPPETEFLSMYTTNENVRVHFAMTNSSWITMGGSNAVNAIGRNATFDYKDSTHLFCIAPKYFGGDFTIDNSRVAYLFISNSVAKMNGHLDDEGSLLHVKTLTIGGEQTKFAVSGDEKLEGSVVITMPENGFLNTTNSFAYKDTSKNAPFLIDTSFSTNAPIAVGGTLDLRYGVFDVDATAMNEVPVGDYPLAAAKEGFRMPEAGLEQLTMQIKEPSNRHYRASLVTNVTDDAMILALRLEWAYPTSATGDEPPRLVIEDDWVEAATRLEPSVENYAAISNLLLTANAYGLAPWQAYVAGFDANKAAKACPFVVSLPQAATATGMRLALGDWPTQPRTNETCGLRFRLESSTAADSGFASPVVSDVPSFDVDLPPAAEGVKYYRIMLDFRPREFNWLWFKALTDDVQIGFRKANRATSYVDQTFMLEYSRDYGMSWQTFADSSTLNVPDSDGAKIGEKFPVEKGEFILVRAPKNVTNNSFNGYSFNMTGKVEVGGDVMSLISQDRPLTIPSDGCFRHLLQSTENDDVSIHALVSAERLKLPATQLTPGCYFAFIADNKALKFSPLVLPAKKVWEFGYQSFMGYDVIAETAPLILAEEALDDAATSGWPQTFSNFAVGNENLKVFSMPFMSKIFGDKNVCYGMIYGANSLQRFEVGWTSMPSYSPYLGQHNYPNLTVYGPAALKSETNFIGFVVPNADTPYVTWEELGEDL